MTLQQLRYILAVAEYGSINAAATRLYSSQSNLSTAIKDLESELGISIFRRSNRGVTLTNEGTELLGYARQVITQADLLEARYSHDDSDQARLAVSTQHYSFSVEAFVRTLEECGGDEYEFVLRETGTLQIIEDVKEFRSEIGILYTDNYNQRVLWKAFDDAHLMFYPLFETPVHVFVGEHHPLAKRKTIQPGDLAEYPRYSFLQDERNSFYYSEEPFAYLPHAKNVRITDRGTLANLLASCNGYTISTGLLSSEMYTGIASIPLETKETMKVGYVIHQGRDTGWLLHSYIANLKKLIAACPDVTSYVS